MAVCDLDGVRLADSEVDPDFDLDIVGVAVFVVDGVRDEVLLLEEVFVMVRDFVGDREAEAPSTKAADDSSATTTTASIATRTMVHTLHAVTIQATITEQAQTWINTAG